MGDVRVDVHDYENSKSKTKLKNGIQICFIDLNNLQ